VLTTAVELLEDGEWHNLEEIYAELAKVITPGQAIRRNERLRKRQNKGERVKPLSEARRIASGKRHIINDSLTAGGYFEKTPMGSRAENRSPDRMIRMVKVPPRVIRDRELKAAGHLFRVEEEIPKLLLDDKPKMRIHNLTRAQVEKLALGLLEALKDEVRGQLRDVAPAAREEAPSE
jgi:hypothetical protein